MNKEEWRRLITETLKETGLYSDNARDLIMGTFAQESNFKYTRVREENRWFPPNY